MADTTKDSQPSAVSGQTPASFPSAAVPPPLGEPPAANSLSDWGVYWRGSVILSLLFGALLINVMPNKTLLAGAFILLMNMLCYPFFLLSLWVWRASPIGFIVYSIFLSGAPLLMSLWVLVSLLLSKGLVVRKHFAIKAGIALVIFLGAWLYAVNRPEAQTQLTLVQESPAPEKDGQAIVLSDEQIQRIHVESKPTQPVAVPSESAPPAIGRAQSVEFRDPNGYFKASLPLGFKVTDKSQGTRSKVILTYSPDFEVVIIASPMSNDRWDPQIELNKKRGAIESGAAGPLSRLKVDSAEVISLGAARGYEMKLSGAAMNASAYAMVGDGVSISLSMVMKNAGAEVLADLFKQSLQQSLVLRPSPPPEEVKAVARP